MSDISKSYIVLANGRVFEGKSFGATGCVIGEAVFTTGMNGYIETLTDPSYFGQIVMQTFPLIGNYGIISKDFESSKTHVRGYVVRSYCDVPSNFRFEKTLDTFLKEQNVIGLFGIDTRALTKVLRESGVMNAMIISGGSKDALDAVSALCDEQKKQKLLEKIRAYKIENAVKNVSCDAVKIEENADIVLTESEEYGFVPVKSDCTKLNNTADEDFSGEGKKIILWDFGAKANIRRELLKRGAEVITMPANASAEDILSKNPDGIMLSNGPGDPQENTGIINELKKIIKSNIPIFGICLGHQLLALAMGAETIKLKYGHRGGNQPVKYLPTGRVYISSQNHGYAVKNETLPSEAILTFVNTNDGTCEGNYIQLGSRIQRAVSSGSLRRSLGYGIFIR